MKNWLKAMIVACAIATATLFTGCATTGGVEKVDAYRLGRFATVAYLSQKDKLDEKHVRAVEVLYATFDSVVDVDMISGSPKDLVMTALKVELKEEPELMMLSNEIIDMYWGRLEANFNISKLIPNAQLDMLKQFNRGIKDALADYKDFGTSG